MNNPRISYFGISLPLAEKLEAIGAKKDLYKSDVVLFGTEEIKLNSPVLSEKIICTDERNIKGNRIFCNEIIEVSMKQTASVSLTGIGDDMCMLAIERYMTDLEGNMIPLEETREKYDTTLSAEENMLYLALRKVLKC